MKPSAGKPIISLGLWTRMQVNIIDVTSHPDNDFKYIMHARDHYIKFSWACPLTQKTAENMAEMLTVHNLEINQKRQGVFLIKTMLTELTLILLYRKTLMSSSQLTSLYHGNCRIPSKSLMYLIIVTIRLGIRQPLIIFERLSAGECNMNLDRHLCRSIIPLEIPSE